MLIGNAIQCTKCLANPQDIFAYKKTTMETKYKFIREGVAEDVAIERWQWVAIYKDGSYLKQYDETDMSFHQFREIRVEDLDVFVMQNSTDETKRYEIHIEEGMMPIHFYRNEVYEAGTRGEYLVKLYCFGYQETIKGVNTKVFFTIFPNDIVSIENRDKRKKE